MQRGFYLRWKGMCILRKARRSNDQRAQRHRDTLAAAKAIGAWTSWLQARQQRKRQQRAMDEHYICRIALAGLAAWRKLTRSSLASTTAFHRALHGRHLRILGRVVDGWEHYAKLRAHERKQMQRAARKHRRTVLERGFAGFSQGVAAMRTRRSQTTTAIGEYSARLLSNVLSRWQRYAQIRYEKNKRRENVDRIHTEGLQRKALNALWSRVLQQRGSRQQQLHYRAVILRGIARRVLLDWQRATVNDVKIRRFHET